MNASTSKAAVKQIEVNILGQSYVLSCRPEEEAALHAAVKHVDREMSAIRDIGKIKARERIAVLAALNIAYALLNAPPSPAADDKDDESSNGNNVAQWRVNNLVSRIDKALANDNQLL